MSNRNDVNDLYPNCVMLTSRDIKKTVAFFRDTLGFELKEAWPDKENPMWANFVTDRQSVMIGGVCAPEKAKEFGCSDAEVAVATKHYEAFQKNAAGVGVYLYIAVPDVDAFHKKVLAKGGKPLTEPKSQLYGLRDFQIQDPTGYTFNFYSPITMENCQSCAMPMSDALPGQMYCQYCTTEKGELKPYEQIFEGTVTNYFMAQMKMPRPKAEMAAREHLSKQPAWMKMK
mgnify:CR=1 FL=1